MSIDFETAIAMQRICTGESVELTRGQIAGEVIDIDKVVKNFKPEKAQACREFFDDMVSDSEKKVYDAELLLEETESIKKALDDFLLAHRGNASLYEILDRISEFFMNPPFEGLDSIEYGVNEVCVFSLVEHFMQKSAQEHDHEQIRREYRDDIAGRTHEKVGDHWIGVYDDLQKRYDKLGESFDGERAAEHHMAACCIVTIAAIRDQDSFALDMAQAGAVQKGIEIADLYIDDKYTEDESVFTNNVIKLYEFVNNF